MNRLSSLRQVQDDASTLRVRALLSLREAIVLADVAENRVRKDIERGVLAPPRIVRLQDARWCVQWAQVFTLAAVYRNECMPGDLRRHVFSRMWGAECSGSIAIGGSALASNSYWSNRANGTFGCLDGHHGAVAQFNCVAGSAESDSAYHSTALCDSHVVYIDESLCIDVGKVCKEVKPRVDLYAGGLNRTEERDDILGGEAVFKGTRLSVIHVGKMFDRGETLANILADYDYLTENDVRFAQLYYRAHPPVGRPRTSAEGPGDDAPIAG